LLGSSNPARAASILLGPVIIAFLDQQAGAYGKLDGRVWADLAHAIWNIEGVLFLAMIRV
jgi:hypothetical protein